MGFRIFKLGLICILYFVVIGIVCPFLVSQPDTIFLWSGIVLLLLCAASIPFVSSYVGKLLGIK